MRANMADLTSRLDRTEKNPDFCAFVCRFVSGLVCAKKKRKKQEKKSAAFLQLACLSLPLSSPRQPLAGLSMVLNGSVPA